MALERPGSIRVGIFAHYNSNPLVLQQEGDATLSTVANRATAQLAFAADVSERVGVRASLPLAVSWGTEDPTYGADGFGLGDLSAGIRGLLADGDSVKFGLHGDIFVPTGRQDAWLGEGNVRVGAGVGLTAGDTEDGFSFSATLGGRTRDVVTTGARLELGPELYTTLGGRLRVSDAFALDLGALGRLAVNEGTNALEALLGAEIVPSDSLAINLAAGRGLTGGVGASDIRILAGLTYRREGPEPELALPSVIDDFSSLPDSIQDDILSVEAEREWNQKQLARITKGQVEIRDPIKFKVGTAKVLDESAAVLDAVDELLEVTPEILHLVIVGHASNEGSYEVNYALSLERAVSVFEELLRRGVHPDRLSVRAMGEIQPVGAVITDADARRVEFRITRAAGAGEELPTYSNIDKLPFNGEQRPDGGSQ
ncbi:MAG: OmpA family protein [Myxococcota bacterium]